METLENYLDSQIKHFAQEGVSPLSKFVETQGPVKKVHFLTAGEGSPLILIHGGGGNVDQWTNMIKPLEAHFKLYIVDRPGCGQTDNFDYTGVDLKNHAIEFIKAFMDALGLERAYFAANSMGGMWSTLFAISYPKRVRKLVLLGAPAGIYNRKLPFFLKLLGVKRLNRFLYATIAKPSVKGTRQLYKQLLMADGQKLSDQYIEAGYLGSILPGAINGWLTLLQNISTLSGMKSKYVIRRDLDKLCVQTLLLWGSQDAFNSTSEGLKACKSNSYTKLITVENAGHLPWLDQKEFCSQNLIKFLLS